MAKVQALAALILGFALGCALVSVWGGRPLAALRPAVPEALDMAAMPTSMMKQPRQFLRAPTHAFQPVQAMPQNEPERFTIVEAEPELVTQQARRELIAGFLAAAAATVPLQASAILFGPASTKKDDKVTAPPVVKSKLCASNPTSKLCTRNSGTTKK